MQPVTLTTRAVAAAAALTVAALLSSCGADSTTRRYSREQAQASLSKLEKPGVVIGEFTLARKNPVVDGDTLRVDGLDTTLRLLAIDTEETFKNKQDRRDALTDFEQYLKDKRGDRARPAKAATPLGEDAEDFAKEFFTGVNTVRLERDHPKEIRGRYNRYLAYVLAFKDGRWVNYNVECVRAGMSPYFTKYGYSRRFHDEFLAAEKEAREAGVGIWNPELQHYRDYAERKTWWDARAEFVKEFERDARGRDDYIVLTNWDALRRLEEREGKEVTLLATVGEIRIGDKGPTKVKLSRRMFNDFTLIFFDKDVFGTSRIAEYDGEYVKIRGFVTKYTNKYNKRTELQIVINTPGQVLASSVQNETAAGAERAEGGTR